MVYAKTLAAFIDKILSFEYDIFCSGYEHEDPRVYIQNVSLGGLSTDQ